MERIAFLMTIKEGCEDEYIRRHQAVWPELQREMARAGIHEMSIYMHGRQLFLYMEVKDYVESGRILSESPESRRWEEYMGEIMETAAGDDYGPADAYPDGLPEVFHWKASSIES